MAKNDLKTAILFHACARQHKYKPLDGILVAGDVVGGPGQQTILDQLIKRGAVMIQGNGDSRVVRMLTGAAPDYFATAHQFAMPRWVVEHLSMEQRDYVCQLPEQLVFQLPGADPIHIFHGSPRHVNELMLPNRECHPNLYYDFVPLQELIGLVAEPVAIFGHTHLQWQARLEGKLAFNPGAINFPEDDYIGAQYATLDWDGVQWQPTFHRVPYDLRRLRADYQESGFLATGPLARVILASVLAGKDFLPVYFGHVWQVAETFGEPDVICDPYIPDEIWDQAERTFLWNTIEGN